MKIISIRFAGILLLCLLSTSCDTNTGKMKKVIFLHHSTGKNVWLGKTNRYLYRLTGKSDVSSYFKKYNRQHKCDFRITEMAFPKASPYGWNNYPFDYYNIWVRNGGNQPYMEEPTLEILTKEYDVIIFKHCYPVSRILPDLGNPDINSPEKRIENYKLQYDALKRKMHEFPDNKFIVWTPAVFNKNQLKEEEAQRTKDFYNWIMNVWDEKDDNIFVWDFYNYETEGGLFLLDKYSEGPKNSHPNRDFSGRIARLFSDFIIDVLNDSAR